jgi:RNA polymerase sigma factor (sigma-70 family)
LVNAAAAGDAAAWNALVDQFAGLVWAVARSHRLSDADAADVSQTTWLRLVERLGELREPERVGAWLATTARRESLRHLRLRGRIGEADLDRVPDEEAETAPLEGLLETERAGALRRAFARLSERCQRLLRMCMADPMPSYEEISAAMDMPVGAIGPTRRRCLDRLRDDGALAATASDTSASS